MITSSASTFSTPELGKRVLYSGNTPTARFFLNSFASIYPSSIGNSPYSMGSLYKQAVALLLQISDEQPESSSLGLHLDHLSLTFETTSGVPIPWNTALYFTRKMLAFVNRQFIGPEYQAYVTDVALDVTIQVSLRLLLDGPLPVNALDD